VIDVLRIWNKAGRLALVMWMLALLLPGWAQASMVRITTVAGPLDIRLLDEAAPRTVTNFLAYVNSGAFNSSFMHRSVPGFVIQGGGYQWLDGASSLRAITTNPPVANEFGADRSNVRGTVAMARLGGQPNSATSQWFVNLANNSSLDSVDGGFTVFGRVTVPGMVVADAIAAKSRVNAGGAFSELPLNAPITGGVIQRQNLVLVAAAQVLNTSTEADRIFNYVEAMYPQYAPTHVASGPLAGYYVRHYPSTGAYIGVAEGQVYALVPSLAPDILPLGSVSDWLALASAAGY